MSIYQQIGLYESLFSARRPLLLTETHTANLSTAARNINVRFTPEPLDSSSRNRSSHLHQESLALKGLLV